MDLHPRSAHTVGDIDYIQQQTGLALAGYLRAADGLLVPVLVRIDRGLDDRRAVVQRLNRDTLHAPRAAPAAAPATEPARPV